jgi:hypothetical protein
MNAEWMLLLMMMTMVMMMMVMMTIYYADELYACCGCGVINACCRC